MFSSAVKKIVTHQLCDMMTTKHLLLGGKFGIRILHAAVATWQHAYNNYNNYNNNNNNDATITSGGKS